MSLSRYLIITVIIFSSIDAFCQQDVDFYVPDHYLPGVKILRVYKNVSSPYVFVLAANNKVYKINTASKVIDDISNLFSLYDTFQFVDIATPDDKLIFVATSSPNVIVLKNGNLSLIDATRGLQGNVRSIGLFLKGNALGNTVNALLIGTTAGFGRYQFDTDIFNFYPDINPVDIFRENFRVSIYVDTELHSFVDPKFIGATIDDWMGVAGGYLWHNAAFGYTNTAFNDFPNLLFDPAYQPDLINLYWGSKNGLYESPMFLSYDVRSVTHYLDGITVNKINNIYGLTSFGFKYFKSTLLVGTKNGLYFSNSTVNGKLSEVSLSFTHLDLLGNININDIETSIASVSNIYPLADCEDEAWLGTDDGVYGIKPDYAKYFKVQTVSAISFENMDNSVSVAQICPGDSVSETIDYNFIHGNSIQWFNGNQPLLGKNSQNITVGDTGDYHAVLFNSCENIHLETNHLNVIYKTQPPSFNYPDKIQQCNNDPDTLKIATLPNYRYRWYTNGVLNGDTSSAFIVNKTGKYKVEVSACINNWVSSKEVEVDMVSIPILKIKADKSIYCSQETASLSVNVPVDTTYSINWYRNGVLLANNLNLTTIRDTVAGSYTVSVNSNISNCSQTSGKFQLVFTQTPEFTFNYPPKLKYCSGTAQTMSVMGNAAYHYRWYANGLLNGDTLTTLSVTQSGVYYLEVSACSGSWVPSKTVQVDFVQLPIPTIISDKSAYCIGDNAVFSVSVPIDTSYTLKWYRDNILLPAYNNLNKIATNTGGNYSVSVTNNAVNSDGSTCSQTSANKTLTFNPLPAINIEKIIKTTLCAGHTVYLLSHYSGGTVQWSTGETTDQIAVTKSGIYKATITSSSGCQADSSITISFLPDPVLVIKDTTICTYKHQSVSLNAPSGFSQYLWNGTPGVQTYQVSIPQTIYLTVTDSSGCQATQPINVTDRCPDVWIPNTFTPNNDGINDTWIIQGLDNDPTVTVKIFTRYGTLIYQSRGYGIAWSGQYQGKRLPTGIYYYVITAKNNVQKFSGTVTIIY